MLEIRIANQEEYQEIVDNLARNNFIGVMKGIRNASGLGLKEVKGLTDQLRDKTATLVCGDPLRRTHGPTWEEFEALQKNVDELQAYVDRMKNSSALRSLLDTFSGNT